MVPPPFDPRNCLLGSYPGFPVSALPTIQIGSNNAYVGYAMGVLYCKANRNCRPHALPGPWYYTTSFSNEVKIFQTFFGLTVDGWIGPQTWGTIQYCATHL